VLTRFPRLKVSFVHSGWAATASREAAGGHRCALQRDVVVYKPTVLTIMLGMNDGSYRAFNPDIFQRFSSGFESIIQTAKQALPGFASPPFSPRLTTTSRARPLPPADIIPCWCLRTVPG